MVCFYVTHSLILPLLPFVLNWQRFKKFKKLETECETLWTFLNTFWKTSSLGNRASRAVAEPSARVLGQLWDDKKYWRERTWTKHWGSRQKHKCRIKHIWKRHITTKNIVKSNFRHGTIWFHMISVCFQSSASWNGMNLTWRALEWPAVLWDKRYVRITKTNPSTRIASFDDKFLPALQHRQIPVLFTCLHNQEMINSSL